MTIEEQIMWQDTWDWWVAMMQEWQHPPDSYADAMLETCDCCHRTTSILWARVSDFNGQIYCPDCLSDLTQYSCGCGELG